MDRRIERLTQDEHGDWVAWLACGHRQHMRHKPPLVTRPWVLTEEGRAGRIGMDAQCILCDRAELPSSASEYKRTAVFDEGTVPAGLLSQHRTKLGVWGVLHVLSGELDFVALEPSREVVRLRAPAEHVIVTATAHEVALVGPVTFFVAFHR